MGNYWGSDTPASMPVPPDPKQPPLVDFGGFCFTAGGLSHNLSQADLDELAHPHFAPPDVPDEVNPR
jgi:hypothetical protein